MSVKPVDKKMAGKTPSATFERMSERLHLFRSRQSVIRKEMDDFLSEMEDLQKAEQGFWVAEKNRNFCDLALNHEKQAKIADLEKTVQELQEKVQKTEAKLEQVSHDHDTVKRWWLNAEAELTVERMKTEILLKFIRRNCADANDVIDEVNRMHPESVNRQPDTPEEERMAVRMLMEDLEETLDEIEVKEEDD